MSLRMTGSSDEWIKVSKAGERDSRVSTASGERRSMSREDEGGSRKYSRDLCDNRDLRDESDESLAETEVYVSDENRWRKASEVFPDHPGDANGRRSRALSERRESGDIRQSLSRKSGFGDGDVNRPSVANRKSYADQGDRQSVSYRKSYASRDDEGDARRSVASRKSYTDDGGDRFERRSTRKSTFEDAGDARRASHKSYADVEDGDLRRSVMRKSEVDLGRDEEGGDVRRATRKSDVREEEGDNLRRSGRMSYASEGPIARQSVANRKSYASIQDSDLRRSVAARASYDLGRDDDGDARRSVVTRKSNREEEIDLNRRSLSRKSYAEGDAEAARLSAAPHMSRMSRSEGEEGPRASRAERRSRLEGAEQRMLSQPPEDFESEILMQDGFRRKSEAYVSDENRWRKASEVFPDHPGDANGRRSRAVSERRESGDIRQSLSRKSGFGDGDVNRPSVANRKSYADQGDRQSVSYRKSYASRDDEGDARRSVASRKSYTDDGGDRFERRSTRKSTFEDAGDARRASRKSYADVEDGDLGRSVMRKSEVDLGRDEEGGDFRRATRKSDVREEEGDLRRSVASRASYNDDEGDARRSVVTRKSTREEEIDMNRRSLSRKSYAEEGPRASRAERRSHLQGAEQRKLSQPPEDSESDILMQDGFRRKSEVRGPKARQMLTLELDADSPSEMKSIVWKFTERGACVKVLNKDCPEASPEMLRAGDLLALINGECVLDQPKAFIQKTWKEQQLEDRFVTLRFKPVDYVDYEV